jgi:triosephosphate isomerase
MICAANFKTNHTRQNTLEYFEVLEKFIAEKNITQEVIVFPTATSLFSHNGKADMGVQNAYFTNNGAFTGELGTQQLDEFSIKTILIGHSERRHVLGETQEFIAKKYEFYKELGFKIIYCIGEPLEVRQSGEEQMLEYLNEQLVGIDTSYENLIIAYEPVWAIGTGLTPTLEDIEKLHTILKLTCKTPILYGGSVKAENAKEILALNNVDGVLVGSGALNVNDFCSMIQNAQELNK